MKKIKRLIEKIERIARYFDRAGQWWNEGGNHYLGVDNDGEPMYSLTNGETVLFMAVCSIGLTGLIALLLFAKEVLTK